MKKTIITLSAIALTASSCWQATEKQAKTPNNENVVKQEEKFVFDDDEAENFEDTTKIPILENVKTILIDRSYFEKTEKGVKQIYHYDSEYGKYGITELNTLGLTSSNSFVYDNMVVSFSIIAEIKLYDNILSLIIRGDTEHSMGIWLVNYNKNDIVDGFYRYVSSYPIGYDEWAESASWTTSVIHTQPKPYIKQESVNWEIQENSRIAILESGEFEVLQTVQTKYEM
ncbi:MAG: hypothetical protein FWC39_02145 [Bacteroidetes bacterium]|nr:hypothetical protein [Bacteroidota bacterium]